MMPRLVWLKRHGTVRHAFWARPTVHTRRLGDRERVGIETALCGRVRAQALTGWLDVLAGKACRRCLVRAEQIRIARRRGRKLVSP